MDDNTFRQSPKHLAFAATATAIAHLDELHAVEAPMWAQRNAFKAVAVALDAEAALITPPFTAA
jgi:hypothetical protein